MAFQSNRTGVISFFVHFVLLSINSVFTLASVYNDNQSPFQEAACQIFPGMLIADFLAIISVFLVLTVPRLFAGDKVYRQLAGIMMLFHAIDAGLAVVISGVGFHAASVGYFVVCIGDVILGLALNLDASPLGFFLPFRLVSYKSVPIDL